MLFQVAFTLIMERKFKKIASVTYLNTIPKTLYTCLHFGLLDCNVRF